MVGRPFLCKHRGCISVLLGIGIPFFHASTQQLYYVECLYVPGIVSCSCKDEGYFGWSHAYLRAGPRQHVPSHHLFLVLCSSTSFSLQNFKDRVSFSCNLYNCSFRICTPGSYFIFVSLAPNTEPETKELSSEILPLMAQNVCLSCLSSSILSLEAACVAA